MLDFEEDKNIINEKQKNNLLDKYSQYIKVKKIKLNLEEIQNIDFNQIEDNKIEEIQKEVA